jgi:cellulose biosynthesis protein BcsQ
VRSFTASEACVHTIAVFSTKGGAGKSAVTVLLAEALACNPYLKRVLVVDLDAQQSASTALMGDESLHAALRAGQSVTALMQARRKRSLTLPETLKHLAVRPAVVGRGKFNFLQKIHILAADREAWYELDEQLREDRRSRNGPAPDALLREALAPLRNDFDIVLIDFPGHDAGPIVRCGLYASDRWLFPVTPDRMGTRDLDGSLRVIRQVFQAARMPFKGLGTLLTMCQNKSSGEYKSARSTLRSLAEKRHVPKLYSAEAELSFWTEVKNALDDTDHCTTLTKKLGESTTAPLYKAVQKLARETLDRLHLPVPAEEAIEANEPVNEVVTQNW